MEKHEPYIFAKSVDVRIQLTQDFVLDKVVYKLVLDSELCVQ